MATWTVGGVTITDEGGSKFGDKDVTKLINMGVSKNTIRDFVNQNASNESVIAASNRGGGENNLQGRLNTTTIGNRFGGSYFGHADAAAAKADNYTDEDIQDYLDTNPDQINPEAIATQGSGYQQLHSNIQQGSQLIKQGRAIDEWGSKYGALQSQYDKLKGNYQVAMDTAQAAKEEAMKIKYTGSTQVANPSALGIKAAQGTPFRGSGLAGTAALARPNKGLKIKTLNV